MCMYWLLPQLCGNWHAIRNVWPAGVSKAADPGQVRHELADKIRVVELRPLETVAGDHGSSGCGKREVNWSSDRASTNYHVRKYAE